MEHRITLWPIISVNNASPDDNVNSEFLNTWQRLLFNELSLKKKLKKKYLGFLTSDYLNIVKQQRLVTCGLTTLSMDIL